MIKKENKKYNIVAVIPARGGSKGVTKKNIRPLLGKPLLAYTIETALGCDLIKDVVVSTDDAQIQNIALEYGALSPFLRPEHLSTDTALAIPTIQHAVEFMENYNKSKYDFIIMLQPTSPLKTKNDITKALTKLINSDAHGIISIVDVDNWHPMKMKKYIDHHIVNYEEPPVENPPRQSLPKVFMVNGALYATKRNVFMDKNTFQGDKCLGYEMPAERSVNIDTEADLLVAEYYLKKKRLDG